MGGPGSGRRWHNGAKLTTEDYQTLDVRRWAREGMLRPGYWGGWQWLRNGWVVAAIVMRAEEGQGDPHIRGECFGIENPKRVIAWSWRDLPPSRPKTETARWIRADWQRKIIARRVGSSIKAAYAVKKAIRRVGKSAETTRSPVKIVTPPADDHTASGV